MKGRRLRCKTANPTHQSHNHEEEKEDDLSSSSCPLCGRAFDMPLLLPCAHTLCGRCLTEKAKLDKHKSALRTASQASCTICAILCPRCCHGVELPCSDWSTATACLPLDPTVSFGAQEKDEDEEGVRKKTLVSPAGADVDLSEEEMERSVSGLHFAIDSSSITPPLKLTNSALTVTFRDSGSQVGARDLCASLPQVYADVEILRGQYYWEVDVCNSALYRIGVRSLAGGGEAWWFERRGSGFHVVFDGRCELLPSVPPQLKTVGMFLNVGGSSITFHNPLTEELLATIPSFFTPPLCPAFQLGQGRLKLRSGLPPPNHVFLSRNSAYRGPEGAGRGRWRRDVAFGSVRPVIEKFEEMAGSDSESGLTSSCSSNSTLTSIPGRSPESSAHEH